MFDPICNRLNKFRCAYGLLSSSIRSSIRACVTVNRLSLTTFHVLHRRLQIEHLHGKLYRWLLRLDNYSVEIEYMSGNKMPADFISRTVADTDNSSGSALTGVSIQRKACTVRNVTKWRHYWIGQSQPPATTAYAAGTLPSCGRHTIKYEIIEVEFDLHHKLHNK